MAKTQPHESAVITYSSEESISARNELMQRLFSYPATDEERERSLGLFIRGSLMARFLAIHDIYRQIINKPGIILDIGTWRGQTAVLCENFRAIYEPLNFNRRIVCFDTFEGYAGYDEKSYVTPLHNNGTYSVGKDYAEYLRQLLALHEKNNAMGHNSGKHKVIAGDCRQTIPGFFAEHKNEFVALAFFDVNAYAPTYEAFEAVYQRLIPGGIAAFWQISRGACAHAEGAVYAEQILNRYPHRIERCATYPGLCYLMKE
ncbi:MAG: class I SAM-dependent methyltransferase [Pseudomonadota bacterium]|nr:class I SAM-dependent methyltransferase [Pseudomonadota bacterium]